MSSTDDPPVSSRHLPRHLSIRTGTRVFYCCSCIVSFLLLGCVVLRLLQHLQFLTWYAVAALPMGMLCADFLSGLVHWGADTWGSVSMPILGQRLLHPFRVHHVNPADFLLRKFWDTNGDVAALGVPVLVLAMQMPLSSAGWFAAAVFVASFSGAGLMTNQIHQWAHMRRAPFPVRWLQRAGLILSHEAHERHHHPPYVANYCITTGWCNGPLQSVFFFSRLERLVSICTGLQPRDDERAFSENLLRSEAGHD